MSAPEVMTATGATFFDAILLDAGASSMHFDDAMAWELRVGTESARQIDSAEIGRRRAGVMERGRKQ